jgi:multicomponent Na+:H+ antiporter subunit G
MSLLTTLHTVVVAGLIAVGTCFLTVGTLGLLRLPDVYNRMHATSKATTLGAAALFLAGVTYYGPHSAGLTALIGIVFLFMTAPTGAHLIARAATRMGISFYGVTNRSRARQHQYRQKRTAVA